MTPKSIPSHYSCPVCEDIRCSTFAVENVGTFYRCNSCGFIFAPEIQSEDAVLYDENFGAANIHPTYRKTASGYVIKNRVKLTGLLAQFEQYRQTGRILDVGCSAAFFMHLAQEKGWQANGVEIAPWAAEFSKKELGVEVFCGTLENAKFENNTFDVIFSSHVLEHISDPFPLIKEMQRVLRPGGLHVSVLPSQFASPSWHISKRFIGDPPPKHTSFFNTHSFTKLIERSGLNVVSCTYNVELMRLYELMLNREQMKAHWQSKLAAANDGGGSKEIIHQGLKSKSISAVKTLINIAGNIFGVGDEIICLATKPRA